jgi:hypothetical protein
MELGTTDRTDRVVIIDFLQPARASSTLARWPAFSAAIGHAGLRNSSDQRTSVLMFCTMLLLMMGTNCMSSACVGFSP